MKRNMMLGGSMLGLAMGAWVPAAASVVEPDTLIPTQLLMGLLHHDLLTLRDLVGPDNHQFDVGFEMSGICIAYSIAPGTAIGSGNVGLNASLMRVDESSWTGMTQFDIMRATTTKTYTVTVEKDGDTWDVQVIGETGPGARYETGWTVTEVEEGKKWTSTHRTGATDEFRKKTLHHMYEWTVTIPDTAAAKGTVTELPSGGTASAVLPTPSSIALLGMGAIMCSRRRR